MNVEDKSILKFFGTIFFLASFAYITLFHSVIIAISFLIFAYSFLRILAYAHKNAKSVNKMKKDIETMNYRKGFRFNVLK